MADDVLMTYGNEDEISDVLNKIERPVHEAICLGKILCPTDECIAQRAYFHESGVVHHLRVKHKKEFSMSDRNKSICVSRQIHERETRACIEKIFEYRKAKVCKLFYNHIIKNDFTDNFLVSIATLVICQLLN